jgi:hypothetical protein
MSTMVAGAFADAVVLMAVAVELLQAVVMLVREWLLRHAIFCEQKAASESEPSWRRGVVCRPGGASGSLSLSELVCQSTTGD